MSEEQNETAETPKCPLCSNRLEEVNLLYRDGRPSGSGWECRSCNNTFDSALENMLVEED